MYGRGEQGCERIVSEVEEGRGSRVEGTFNLVEGNISKFTLQDVYYCYSKVYVPVILLWSGMALVEQI